MPNVLLIGLGRVGWKYDLSDIAYSKDSYLTHFKSLRYLAKNSNNRFKLYVHDISPRIRREFQSQEPSVPFLSSEEQLARLDWDLVIVATYTSEILTTVKKFNKWNKKTKFVIEKPVTEDVEELRNFLKDNLNTDLLDRIRVGFPRRTLESSEAFKKVVQQSERTEHLDLELNFSGGITNILSHFVDLLDFWFGPLEPISIDVFEKKTKLRAVNSPEFTINITQTSNTNNEDTSIFIRDRDLLVYRNSGRSISIFDQNLNKTLYFQGEIQRMLLTEATDYIAWGLDGFESRLTKLPNRSLELVLELGARLSNG